MVILSFLLGFLLCLVYVGVVIRLQVRRWEYSNHELALDRMVALMYLWRTILQMGKSFPPRKKLPSK